MMRTQRIVTTSGIGKRGAAQRGFNYDVKYLLALNFSKSLIEKCMGLDKDNWICTGQRVLVNDVTTNIFFNKQFLANIRKMKESE